MLRLAPIRFTDHIGPWTTLLEALGLAHAVDTDGWHEFDAASGRVRLHATDADHPAGTTLLSFEVGDLEEFARRTRAAGTPVEVTEEAHGSTATITGPDGLAFPVTVQASRPEPAAADPDVQVLVLWMTPEPQGPAETLRHIGARPRIASDSGGWVQFQAKNGGLVATHSGPRAFATLSFEYDGDAEALHTRLREAGLDASLIDESYGRTVLVGNPDGGEPIWINEAQQDLYGYHRIAD